MNAIELLARAFDGLHGELRADIVDVPPQTLFWQPAPKMNHIGFLFWHIARDEDAVISFLAQRPELWQSHGWHAIFGFDPKEQGTGLDPARLESFRFEASASLAYAEAVWQATGPAVASMGEARLDEPAWPGSDWNVARQLVEGCIGHGWLHLGEIRYIKGLRGWRFRE